MVMVGALLTAIVGTTELGTSDRILCNFPLEDRSQPTLSVELRPTPSLRDKPGLFRMKMRVGARDPLQATAQPIDKTETRDMAVTAKGADDLYYALGLNDDGQAALNIRLGGTTASETFFGTCQGADKHMDRWLPE